MFFVNFLDVAAIGVECFKGRKSWLFVLRSSFNEGASLEKLFVISTYDLPGCNWESTTCRKKNTHKHQKKATVNEHGITQGSVFRVQGSFALCAPTVSGTQEAVVLNMFMFLFVLGNMIHLVARGYWNDLLEAPPRGK